MCSVLHTSLLALWLRGPPRERQTQGLLPAFSVGIFPGRVIPVTLNIGTPVATLPGVLRYRISAETGWPGVSILRLGETESMVCNFYFSVTARTTVGADPSPTLACCWDVKQTSQRPTTIHASSTENMFSPSVTASLA